MTDLTIDRAISGDITPRRVSDVEQGTPEEFLAAIDELLNDESIDSVRWEQYTPYFADGEPCEFSVRELRVKFVGIEEDAGDYKDGYLDSWSLGYEESPGVFPYRPDFVSVETAAKIADYNEDRFYDVLQENFGDHAQVTATLDGFNVEYYEHE